MRRLWVLLVGVFIGISFSGVNAFAQQPGEKSVLVRAIEKANTAREAIVNDKYKDAVASLDQADKLVAEIDAAMPSREVVGLLNEADKFARQNDFSGALQKLTEAEAASMKLLSYQQVNKLVQAIRTLEKSAREKDADAITKGMKTALFYAKIRIMQRRIDEINAASAATKKFLSEQKKKSALDSFEKLIIPLTRLEYLLPLLEARGIMGDAYDQILKKDFAATLTSLEATARKVTVAKKYAKETEIANAMEILNKIEEVKKSIQAKEPRSAALIYGLSFDINDLMTAKVCLKE